jgi:Holliday junction DNA helicase RuvA
VIAYLSGRLLEKHPNRLVVDVHGVGYDVQVPLSTFYEMAEPGADVSLKVHTHVREDQIALFGFGSQLELELFERLIAVGGIGPKLALAALSGLEPTDLVRAVRTSDIARLSSVPGIGRKTAERICLELKDKMPAAAPAAGVAVPVLSEGDELRTDLLSALVNLGYQRHGAERVVDRALREAGDQPVFEQVLKQALRGLAK